MTDGNSLREENTDRQTDGRTDRWTVGRSMDGRRMDGGTDRQTDGRTNRRKDRLRDGWANRQGNGRIDVCTLLVIIIIINKKH